MFAPLAFTVAIALLASCCSPFSPFLRSAPLFSNPARNARARYCARLMAVPPSLAWALGNRWTVIIAAAGLLVFSLSMTPFLGTEFIPRLDEGYLTPQVIRLPSVSVPESIEIERQMQQALMKFPEVVSVVSKMAAPEIAIDPMGPNLSDPIVSSSPTGNGRRRALPKNWWKRYGPSW